MIRPSARTLPLLFLLACLAPTLSAAKSKPIPLPEPNPERPADAAAAQPPSAVAPAGQTADLPAPNPNPEQPNDVAAAQPPSAAPAAGPAAPLSVPSEQIAGLPLPNRNPKHVAVSTQETDIAPKTDALPLPHKKPERSSSPGSESGMDFTSILKPLLDYELGVRDRVNVREAFRLSSKRQGQAAKSAIDKIKDPAARKLATWYFYRKGNLNASPEAIEAFRVNNLEWPGRGDLREQAEAILFLTEASPAQIKAFFLDSKPETGAGKAALAGAYMTEGNEAEAKKLVISAWREHQFGTTIEKKIRDRFGSMLTPEHHRARIDTFLYPDKKSKTADALRVAKHLSKIEQKKVAARIAVIRRAGNAGRLLDALPVDAHKDDVGLQFSRIQWLRRKDKQDKAWELMLAAPRSPDVLLNLNEWWIERRINCRKALKAKKYRIAYDIAAKRGPATGDYYLEAEFLSGWIALRFLSEPNTALGHFVAMRAASKTSKSISRAEYWLGRTALALGDSRMAIVHFHVAAKYPQFFHGQLARQALDPKPANLEVTSTPLPTPADMQRFMAHDAARAIGVAIAADVKGVLPQFYLALSRTLKNPTQVVLVAELAKATNHRQLSLRLAKIAFNRDLPVGEYAMPINLMPEFKSLLSERVEPALVYALSRQESEFNAGAKSPVGASGLMQLMPATARAVARQYKVKYVKAQLTNAAYNCQLGEAHLSDLIDSYRGSYFMALAAYNAGGGRVKEWVDAFGDPRDPSVDPIDWVESIPFTETRHYVIKIMETLQLYRSRLQGPQQALRLVQDLHRGRRIERSQTTEEKKVKAASN
jgi:soluble lytic murein transglycosylase